EKSVQSGFNIPLASAGFKFEQTGVDEKTQANTEAPFQFHFETPKVEATATQEKAQKSAEAPASVFNFSIDSVQAPLNPSTKEQSQLRDSATDTEFGNEEVSGQFSVSIFSG